MYPFLSSLLPYRCHVCVSRSCCGTVDPRQTRRTRLWWPLGGTKDPNHDLMFARLESLDLESLHRPEGKI